MKTFFSADVPQSLFITKRIFRNTERRLGVGRLKEDFYSLFKKNTITRDQHEASNVTLTKTHTPDMTEFETEAWRNAENEVQTKASNARKAIEAIENGDHAKKHWGHIKDLLATAGIDSGIIHESPLIFLMNGIQHEATDNPPMVQNFKRQLLELVALMEENPRVHGKKVSGVEDKKHYERNALLVRLLCTLGIASKNIQLESECRSFFSHAKNMCQSSPQLAGILCLEASISNKSKKFNEACRLARKAIRCDNMNSMAYYHAAYALAALGSVSDAVSTLNSGLQVITDNRRDELMRLKEKLTRRDPM